MGTRSFIIVECADGFRGSYCHWDGYLEHNGRILKESYTDFMKVCELINQGDMSSLGSKINPDPATSHSFAKPQDDVCVFYGRDRGETGTEFKFDEDLEELSMVGFNMGAEFIYLFDRNNKWNYMTRSDDSFVSF